MYERPEQPVLTPPGVLLTAVFQLYLRSFRPLFLTAAAAASIPALLALTIQPETAALAFAWTVLLLALEFAAHAAVFWTAAALWRGHRPNAAGTLMAVFAFGPRFFAAAFLIFSVALLSVFAVFFIPLAIFVGVRLSLYGPAFILENQSILGGFRRSWLLVQDRWWRTFGMEAGIFSVPLLASLLPLLLLQAEAAMPVLFLANVSVSGVVVPLLACFFLLVFDDYRRVTDKLPVDGPSQQGGGMV